MQGIDLRILLFCLARGFRDTIPLLNQLTQVVCYVLFKLRN